MLAIIACAFLLAAIGYFVVLCGAEIVWSLRSRLNSVQSATQQPAILPSRQIITR